MVGSNGFKSVKMKFLATILLPFRFWQIFSLVPFGLISQKLYLNKASNLHYFSMASLVVHAAALLHGLFVRDLYVPNEGPWYTQYDEIISLGLMRFIACVIVLEAIVNRRTQFTVLEMINQIDLNLKFKLRIKINYKRQQFHYNTGTILWLLMFIISDITILVYAHAKGQEKFKMFWLFYSIPFTICGFQYQRLAYYATLLRQRYQLLNKFLLNICSIQEAHQIESDSLDIKPKHSTLDSLITTIQVRDFRNIYQQLYDVSTRVNDIFWWSLPLCILSDFHKLLVNAYLIFAMFLVRNSGGDAIIWVLWGICNVVNLLLVSHACHSTSIAVWIEFNYYSILLFDLILMCDPIRDFLFNLKLNKKTSY